MTFTMTRLLNGSEMILLRDALVLRYGDIFTINEFTKSRLNKNFNSFIPPFASSYTIMVFQFIDNFNRKGWHSELIAAYLADYPDDKDILKLAFDLGITAGVYAAEPSQELTHTGLQNLLDSTPFVDVTLFLNEISRIERCVCRIEIELQNGGLKWGTGVLVGSDLLMTNYHVLRELINQPDSVKSIICRFDYNITASSGNIFEGNLIKLSAQPVVAHSPFADLDNIGMPTLQTAWPPDQLDYALVQVERKIANEPFGPTTGAVTSPAKRGFIPAPATKPSFFKGGHIFIVQHPNKQPKKIAFGFGKLEGMDAAEQRVRYKVNTLPGSSGSPCFNEKYEWVALHNMGDPLSIPLYNQGIPVFRILSDLQKKGIILS
jgi:Trypsin-like peptidase domain